MARIVLTRDNLDKEVPDGKPLVDFCREENSTICFGCEVGVCATCLVEVVEGSENLSSIDDIEQNTLERVEALKNQRLACQCKVLQGKVVLD